jgi:hypothetical protein
MMRAPRAARPRGVGGEQPNRAGGNGHVVTRLDAAAIRDMQRDGRGVDQRAVFE